MAFSSQHYQKTMNCDKHRTKHHAPGIKDPKYTMSYLEGYPDMFKEVQFCTHSAIGYKDRVYTAEFGRKRRLLINNGKI